MVRKAFRTGLASASSACSVAIDIIDRDGTRWHKCLHDPTCVYHFQTRLTVKHTSRIFPNQKSSGKSSDDLLPFEILLHNSMPDFSISSCAFLGFDPGEPWDIPTNDVLKDGSENIQFTQHKTILTKTKLKTFS